MILVFGKTGQVGRELQAFRDIKTLDRAQADLSNPQTCENVIKFYKPRAVINAAAFTSVDKAETQEDLASIINGIAPVAMAAACAALDIPIVHISSDYIFDGTGTNPWRISDIPNPRNIYGKSKLQGEEGIKALQCKYAILRTSWVVSAYGNNFVKSMLCASATKGILNVVNDQIGGPTCARDIARTCLLVAEKLVNDPNKSGVYHYSGQPDVSWCQFANAIFEQAGRSTRANPIATSDFTTPAQRPSNSRLDCARIQEVFDIPRPYWRDGLKEILQDLWGDNDGT